MITFDNLEEALDFAQEYADLGDAVQRQLRDLLEQGNEADINPNAVNLIKNKLSLFSAEIMNLCLDWENARQNIIEECDQCGANRESWQDSESEWCPNHANPHGSCDGILRAIK